MKGMKFMNETNVRNEILDSIDRVNHITLESSLDVLFSLGTAYEKAAMITEYASTPDELSMFSIFQEADTPTQDNATTEAKPAENTSTTVSSDEKAPAANAEAKKKSGILWFIPNLIKKLFQFLCPPDGVPEFLLVHFLPLVLKILHVPRANPASFRVLSRCLNRFRICRAFP